MPLSPITPTTPHVLRTRMALEHFKCCPLCGALNVRENEECFVCRWHGDFDRTPVLVETKLRELVSQCPDLVPTLSRRPIPRRAPQLKRWFYRLRSWLFRVDFRA